MGERCEQSMWYRAESRGSIRDSWRASPWRPWQALPFRPVRTPVTSLRPRPATTVGRSQVTLDNNVTSDHDVVITSTIPGTTGGSTGNFNTTAEQRARNDLGRQRPGPAERHGHADDLEPGPHDRGLLGVGVAPVGRARAHRRPPRWATTTTIYPTTTTTRDHHDDVRGDHHHEAGRDRPPRSRGRDDHHEAPTTTTVATTTTSGADHDRGPTTTDHDLRAAAHRTRRPPRSQARRSSSRRRTATRDHDDGQGGRAGKHDPDAPTTTMPAPAPSDPALHR